MGTVTSFARRVVALAGNALGTERTRELSATHAPEAATLVSVSTTDGSVEVVPTDTEAVTVDAVALTTDARDDLDAVSLDVTETGDTVDVSPDVPADAHAVSVSLTVGVPERLAVERVAATNGRLTVRDVAGDPTLATTNGRIDATRVAGTVTAETENGRITATDTRVERARAENGEIELALPDVPGDVTATTTNGRVTVRVPDDADAHVDLATDVGRVDVADPVAVESDSATHVVGTLGDGGPTVTARATCGAVALTGR